MSRATTVSATACGKAILIGEHFVVFGGTALAFPVLDAQLTVTLRATPQQRNRVILAPGFPESERVREACRKGLKELASAARYRLDLSVSGNLDSGAGLGASAAFSVAFARAYLKLSGRADEDLVAQAGFEMERAFHGHPSGIDSTTVAFQVPCYLKTGDRYVNGQEAGASAGFIDIAPGAVFLLADTGERRHTRDSVDTIKTFAQSAQGSKVLTKLVDISETIALQTAAAIKDGDFEYVGSMMNENHYLLRALEVSTPKLERLRLAALGAGALGAKLTGAGGGGYLLALCWPEMADDVADSLCNRGAVRVIRQPTDQLSRLG